MGKVLGESVGKFVGESVIFEIKKVIKSGQNQNESLLFQGKNLPINVNNFKQLETNIEGDKEVFYIDGGQAEVLVASNFVLAYLRVAAVGFKGLRKTKIDIREGYVLVKAKGEANSIVYSAQIFNVLGEVSALVDNAMLTVDSEDKLFRVGTQRAPILKLVGMTRRFIELGLAKEICKYNENVIVVIDGALDAKYPNEEKIISTLPETVVALAKSSQLFTSSGGSPTVLLSNLSLYQDQAWIYSFLDDLHFVKLHHKAKHVLRFSGSKNYASLLVDLSNDPIFLGYPYPLILVDKLARVSEKERLRLQAKFLLRKDLDGIAGFLATQNAHRILDNIG